MAHIHFIGIGGTGLSAIAKVLLEQGNEVSGSDLLDSPLFEAVKAAGGSVTLGHRKENIRGADLVIRSSAIPDDNPEVLAAKAAGVPVLKRSEFLGQLTAGKQVLAVAGSHGKTTTTSMLVWILSSLNMDPSFIVGGVVGNLGTNARAGKGKYFVVEADEYDYMFLGLHPQIAVVTNVEHDHPDIFPTPESFREAFRLFVANLQPGGTLITCLENPEAQGLGAVLQGDQSQITYGFEGSSGNYTAANIHVNQAAGMDFEIRISDKTQPAVLPVSLRIPGKHNVLNALAAFALADRLELKREAVIEALGEFQGSERRFDIRKEQAGVLLVDDYGHHPTEIRATLAAARSVYPDRYIRAVWQPHTYSRTRTLQKEFSQAFENADQVIVMDVYEAREQRPADFQIEKLVKSVDNANALYLADNNQVAGYLEKELKQGDLLLVFSAGDAVEVTDRVEKFLSG